MCGLSEIGGDEAREPLALGQHIDDPVTNW